MYSVGGWLFSVCIVLEDDCSIYSVGRWLFSLCIVLEGGRKRLMVGYAC